MLKGIGIGSIIKLVLAIMIASLFISLTTIGAFGDALQHSFDNIGTMTDFTVEVEDKETLSQLYTYVLIRSYDEGCDTLNSLSQSDEEPFPKLSESYLTANPPCFGGESGIIRDGLSSLNPADGWFGGDSDENFMPGVYSREQFEITTDEENGMLLDAADGTTAIDSSLGTATDYSLTIIADMVEEEDDADGLIDRATDRIGNTLIAGGYGLHNSIELVPTNGLVDIVNSYFGSGVEILDRETRPLTVVFQHGELKDRTNVDPNMDQGDLDSDFEVQVRLCDGDKGYIQSNRGRIDDGGFSDNDPIYPILVIEEIEVDHCGDVNFGREDMIPDHATTTGQVLSITTRGSIANSYPNLYGSEPNVFNLHDVKDDGYSYDPTWGGSMRVSVSQDRCSIGVFDSRRRSATDSEALIEVSPGYLLEKDAGGFPRESEDKVIRERYGGRTAGADAEDTYSDLQDRGFDGSSPGESSSILYSYAGNERYELYGDLLCADDGDWSSWKMCDGDKTVSAGGIDWTCDGLEGEWRRDE